MNITFGRPFTFYRATATGPEPIQACMVYCDYFKENNLKITIARWHITKTNWMLYNYHSGEEFRLTSCKTLRKKAVLEAIESHKEDTEKYKEIMKYLPPTTKKRKVLNI